METDFSTITFTIEEGCLVANIVARRTGQPYRHACPSADFERIVREIDEADREGISRDALHAKSGIPWTRLQVALLFLNERSCVNRQGKRGRLYAAASKSLFEDAMVEFHALREKGPGV